MGLVQLSSPVRLIFGNKLEIAASNNICVEEILQEN